MKTDSIVSRYLPGTLIACVLSALLCALRLLGKSDLSWMLSTAPVWMYLSSVGASALASLAIRKLPETTSRRKRK